MSLAADLLAAARAKGLRVATAESCTGGLLASAITDVAGSSDIFDRGVVTYSNAAKTDLLGVKPATLDAHGAVSEQVAAEMAAGVLARSAAQIAVSTTGIAGPGGSDFKPEGRVCFGVATAAGTRTETVEFGALGRAKVRAAAVDHALRMLIAAVAAA
ncbi:MAG: nicotinamide-nucleotide amidohydrolase family protein [Limimaricola sp.]|uniref:CinA family protein n=1 Tax=Limimaricola sp. TaxID=2211665 RepID=UPI001DAC1930|nr:CinA family protein [Limimaricola sp.]MBI1418118.1 nicotinamide-nucleotide amidohydrolase family protein [Limimaricola sp.]